MSADIDAGRCGDDLKVIHGDCLEVLPTFAKSSVDLIVTSPPYDGLRTYNGKVSQWGEQSWKSAMVECHRVLRDGGVMVWIVDDQHINGGESLTHMRQALWWVDAIGGLCHDTMIWNKGCFQSVGNLAVRYAQVHEYMLVLSKGRPTVFHPLKDRPNKVRGKIGGTIRNRDGTLKLMSTIGNARAEHGQRFSIWNQTPCKDRKIKHPARFPVALATDHILSWSNPGDTVLDPFMGSGTTGVACQRTGRNFIGIEREAEYIRIASARLATVWR